MTNETVSPEPPGQGMMALLPCFLGLSGMFVFAVYLAILSAGRMMAPEDLHNLQRILPILYSLMWASSLAGITLGIMSLVGGRPRKGFAAAGIALCLLHMAACASMVRGGSPPPDTVRDDVSTRPIPMVAQSTTEQSRRGRQRDWLRHNMLDPYEKVGLRSPAWDEQARDLISKSIDHFAQVSSELDDEDLLPLARSLMELECEDPLVLYCCGRTLQDDYEKYNCLERAIRGFEKGDYPGSVGLIACLWCGDLVGKEVPPLGDRALSFLRAGLEDGSLLGEEGSLQLAYYLTIGPCKWLISYEGLKMGDKVGEILDGCPGVDRWTNRMYWGHLYIDKAWGARGNDWSHTVTDDGWKGFEENLNKATEALKEAYQLRPDRPGAASLMITVAMGKSGNSRREMRLWFDRAVSAQIDCSRAYGSFRLGMWPRWAGSNEDLRQFGQICLDTERYDTLVPFEYFYVLNDLASSSDLDSIGQVLQNDQNYETLKTMLERYLSEESQKPHERFFRSHLALAAFEAGRYSDAFQNLQKIDFKITGLASVDWRVNLTEMVGVSCALGGQGREDILAGEQDRERGDWENALDHLGSAQRLCESDERALSWVSSEIAAVSQEKQLESGDWISFIPPPDFQGWLKEQAGWEVMPDGSLESKSALYGMLLACKTHVGSAFELEGKIEIMSPHPHYQAGIVFGDLEPDSRGKEWISCRFLKEDDGRGFFKLSQCFHRSDREFPTSVLLKNEIRLACWNGQITVWLNGEEVFKNVSMSDEVQLDERGCKVGFGTYNNCGEVRMRYSDFRLHRLKTAPSPDGT